MILVIHSGDRVEEYTVSLEELIEALDNFLRDPFLERIQARAEDDPMTTWTVYDVTD